MKRRNLFFYLTAAIILLCSSGFDSIGNSLKTMQVMVQDQKLYMIFKNESDQELLFDSGTLFFGGQALDDTEVSTITDSDIPLTTLFLVDVTKTVLYTETARVTEAAEVFASNPVFIESGRSRFFLQTFGKVVSQVSGPTEDPVTLVSKIKYEDNISDYFYALSEAVDFLKDRIDSGIAEKQQIIIFTDAVGYTETTITESQLKDKLRKSGIPVYGIALYNTNTELINREEVGKLLELAEISGGTVLNPKDYSDSTALMTNEIIRDIVSCYDASASISDEIIRSDNNSYSVSLTVDYLGNRIADVFYSASVKLPDLPTQTPEPTETPTETPEPTETLTATPKPTETPVPAEITDPDEGKKWIDQHTYIADNEVSNKWILFGIIGTFVSVGIIILRSHRASSLRKRRERRNTGDAQTRNAAYINTQRKMMMVKMVQSVNISLTRVGTSGSVPIRVKLRDNEEVKFGRTPAAGVIALDNDDTISSVHFKLVYMNGFIYIEDMASSNGVILNGLRLTQRARLNDGDHLLLGKLTYQFHIISLNDFVMKKG